MASDSLGSGSSSTKISANRNFQKRINKMQKNFDFIQVDASKYKTNNGNIVTKPRITKKKIVDDDTRRVNIPFIDEVRTYANRKCDGKSDNGFHFINEIENLFPEAVCSVAVCDVDVLWDCSLLSAFASKTKGWYCKIVLSDISQSIPSSILPDFIRKEGLAYLFDQDPTSSTCSHLKYLQDLLVLIGDAFSFTSLHSDRWNVENFNYVTSGCQIICFPSSSSVGYFVTLLSNFKSLTSEDVLKIMKDLVEKGGKIFTG